MDDFVCFHLKSIQILLFCCCCCFLFTSHVKCIQNRYYWTTICVLRLSALRRFCKSMCLCLRALCLRSIVCAEKNPVRGNHVTFVIANVVVVAVEGFEENLYCGHNMGKRKKERTAQYGICLFHSYFTTIHVCNNMLL